MRPLHRLSSLATLSLLLLVGCGGPNASKLYGTWRMEGAEQLAQAMFGDNKPEGALGSLLGSAMSMMADKAMLEVEFASGGKLTTRAEFAGNKTEKTGTWKLVRTDGSTYVIWCQLGQEDPVEISAQLSDDSTLQMVPPNIAASLKRSFTFKRVQP
ncbi:MAG TPA: hypothetical protein PLI18_03770 [Pirellulaceae bacterium]|mgnify:CR=1 FL=1|nr:hypothetical protein [Pirellulaceae bacterium]